MRRIGIATIGLALAVLFGALPSAGPARAGQVGRFLQAGTPAASPAATAPPPIEAAPPAATVPPTPAPTDVVTLVAWYALDPSEQFLNIYPLAVDQGQRGGQGGDPIGRANFPEGEFPTLSLGDSQFTSYLRFEGDVPERWTWFNDEEPNRPATLVLQISGLEGTYEAWFGTATFVSLDEDVPSSGVLTLALQPPDAGAATEDAAEDNQADEAATDAPAEEVGAEATEPPAEEPTATEAPAEEPTTVEIGTAPAAEGGEDAAAPTQEPS